jgi:hypothetical protein
MHPLNYNELIIIIIIIIYYYYYLRVNVNVNFFENRVLRTIFVPKREELAGGWGRLHNEELHNLYATPNIIRVIKSWRMRWARM